MEPRVAPFAGEKGDRIGDLDRIAGGARERLVHVGDERDRRQAGADRDRGEPAREVARAFEARHEGARAGLDVHDEALQPGGELLGQDRGGDQRDRFDGGGHVADRIEPLVGGREILGLADDRAAGLGDRAPEQREIGLGDIAGDGIELVERAAGMAEAAARDHRHKGAAGGEHGGEHQADIVADAAGRMLVEDRAGQRGAAPVERGRPSASSRG